MKKNIAVAKRLVRIAKQIISSDNLSDVYYRFMDIKNNQLSINFVLKITQNQDKYFGWMDSMLSTSDKLNKIGKKFGFKVISGMMDLEALRRMKSFSGDSLCSISFCMAGGIECDMDSFINSIVSIYNAKEIK